MAEQKNVLKLDARDNVAIALKNLPTASRVAVNGTDVELVTDVPVKYKFAMQDLSAGDAVIMYGVMVGKAVAPIRRGEVITVRNLRHEATPFHEKSGEFHWKAPDISKWRDRTFLGYHRADGQVGTRNHWLVIPLVFCENRNIGMLKQAFEEELGFASPPVYRQQVAHLAQLYREGKIGDAKADGGAEHTRTMPRSALFKNVDGIQFLIHQGGCGGTREDSNNLCGLLAGYIHHPNVAGATVLSLGCQHSQTAILREQIRLRDPHFSKPLIVFEQQQSASEFAMLSEAIRQTFLGLVEANKIERAPAPLSKLTLGLKCGGSDGFSGISANPAIGHTADLLATLGGRGILSEFPELCGVEQDLINRSASKEVGDRFMQLMRDYSARAKAVGSGFDMNPSPGNIRDGLITDAMKSAGAEKKGGTSPVTGVLDYPEYSSAPGLNLQCTPGNDVECVTAQVGAGASVVLFTTGLGTPTGNPITPVVKISTNSDLARRMGDIIDVNAGAVVSGEKTIEQMGETILDFVAGVASGDTHTKAEMLAQHDFIPWKRGVSL
jgi:altronate hydrolase